MEVRQLPSGLLVASSEEAKRAPTKAAPADPIRCGHCGRESVGPEWVGSFWWKTRDGFFNVHSTCEHGRHAECPDCHAKCLGCPACGCQEEYT